MEMSTVAIIGGVVVAGVVFFAYKNRCDASSLMENNTNVIPLMLQRSGLAKAAHLRGVTMHDLPQRDRLRTLAETYEENRKIIHPYDPKLVPYWYN